MRYLFLGLIFLGCNRAPSTVIKGVYNETHRPQIHFSPKANWMNDPNGLVYFNGTYHLFFQYYPDSTVWGPMHWGHATSKDLVYWTEQPIALYPDSLGYIFSGSAVVDSANSSGFGKDGKIPLVAIFTYHDAEGEKSGRNDYQTQGLAYSLDEGKSWTKYENNPVLPNPGIKDFRDPKVMWYAPGKKWIMTLATLDRISFYSSPDLKNWVKESEFGESYGAHGGVWECPDLIPFQENGDSTWVLFVSINPGGPNGGSATQYFAGSFDGKIFKPDLNETRWLDHGPDNYAGVTWSNVGGRKLFLGWMSNWLYGQQVPTFPWRSAMTIPRDLYIQRIGDKVLVGSKPSPELDSLNEKEIVWTNVDASAFELAAEDSKLQGPARVRLKTLKRESFEVTLSNASGEALVVGYDKAANQYFIDRGRSGKIDFVKGFGAKFTAPRASSADSLDMELVIDNSSIEMFADKGLTVMTAVYFPTTPYSDLVISSKGELKISRLTFQGMRSIWKQGNK
jgi:fructan beta-fructosidase